MKQHYTDRMISAPRFHREGEPPFVVDPRLTVRSRSDAPADGATEDGQGGEPSPASEGS